MKPTTKPSTEDPSAEPIYGQGYSLFRIDDEAASRRENSKSATQKSGTYFRSLKSLFLHLSTIAAANTEPDENFTLSFTRGEKCDVGKLIVKTKKGTESYGLESYRRLPAYVPVAASGLKKLPPGVSLIEGWRSARNSRTKFEVTAAQHIRSLGPGYARTFTSAKLMESRFKCMGRVALIYTDEDNNILEAREYTRPVAVKIMAQCAGFDKHFILKHYWESGISQEKAKLEVLDAYIAHLHTVRHELAVPPTGATRVWYCEAGFSSAELRGGARLGSELPKRPDEFAREKFTKAQRAELETRKAAVKLAKDQGTVYEDPDEYDPRYDPARPATITFHAVGVKRIDPTPNQPQE